jgi:aromatic-amino-acid transaminase
MLETLSEQPQDAILKLIESFREDPREDKIDLGVGVYRDASGKTPIMRAVKAAERRIWEAQDTKAYTGLAGDPAFGRHVRDLVLGGSSERASIVCTPGGTGAVQKGFELARLASGGMTVHLPDPTWPNHPAILRHMGVPTETYRYFDPATCEVDLDAMVEDLGAVPRGDVVVLHGCCHNPTGADPDAAGWERIVAALEASGALVLVDLAYLGFGDGLEEDAAATRLMAERLPELMVAVSCSKNFGIYRERTGALLTLSDNAHTAQGAMAALNRLNYSFPPDHGARIVLTILDDEELAADWRSELSDIRAHMLGLREQLASELRQRTNSDRFDFIAKHRGMFSRTGATPEQVEHMRKDRGVYMVGDGRINVAGLNAETVPLLAAAMVEAGL